MEAKDNRKDTCPPENEEEKQGGDGDKDDVQEIKQDDYIYKLKLLSEEKKQTIIENLQAKKRHKVQFSRESECLFIGLPPELESLIKEKLKFETYVVEMSPFETLMVVNYWATDGLSKKLNKSPLYERIETICDQIERKDPEEYFWVY